MSYQYKSILSASLVGALLCVVSGAARATSYQWVGPNNGAWNDAKNWSPNGVPGAEDSASIPAKKKVAVPVDATVANLTVGAGAEIKNGGKIKVTNKTTSSGLFIGLGSLDVPAGATASFLVDTTGGPTLAANRATTVPKVVFAPINNKGRLQTKVAQGSRVDFASIKNDGLAQITSDGTVTFQDIKNTQQLSVRASGVLTLAKIDNDKGGILSIATTALLDTGTKGTRGKDQDNRDPSVVHLDSLTNRAGGRVKLSGVKEGRYFNGKSISNEGVLQISGAQTLLEGDVDNKAGAVLTIDSEASLFPSDKNAPKLKNSGKVIKPAGSDATLNVEWANSGQVVIGEGTLHVRVPQKKGANQSGGLTTLEGGVLSVEDATNTDTKGTFSVTGGVVDGIGTIEGNVVNDGGTFKPGHSPGSITINGNFTQTANGVLNMEVGGTTPGTGYDQILVNGTANFGGTLNILRWGNYVPKDGDIYTLFTYYAKSGNFSQMVDGTPVYGLSYDTTLTPTEYELNCYSTAPPDSVPPASAITAPLNNSAVRSLVSATGSASDNTGVASVTCRLYRYANPLTGLGAGYWAGGTTWTSSATASNEMSVSGTTAWTFTFPPLAAGRYSLRSTATDVASNKAISTTNSFWIDPNVPSVLTIATPLNNSTVLALPAINGTVSDASNGSGIVSVQYRLRRATDGLYWTGTTWASGVFTLTTSISGAVWSRVSGLPTGTNLKVGKYSLAVITTDRAGNTRSATSNFTVSSLLTADSAPTG